MSAASDEDTRRRIEALAKRLTGVAAYVAAASPGDRAALRRLAMRPQTPPDAFWRIVERFEVPVEEERFWLAILPAMVDHPHAAAGPRIGVALAYAGVRPMRVRRWLGSSRNAAQAHVRRLLSQWNGPVDWIDLGFLLWSWANARKRAVARDFFLSSANSFDE